MTDEFGRVEFEVLPSRRYVRVTLDGAQNEVRHDFEVGSSEVRFATVAVFADDGVEVDQYYARGWRPFTDGMEILPTRIYVGLADGSRPPRNQLVPGVANFVPSGNTVDLTAQDGSDEPTSQVSPGSTNTTARPTTTTTAVNASTTAVEPATTGTTVKSTSTEPAPESTSEATSTAAESESTTSTTKAESATTTVAPTTSAVQSDQDSDSDSDSDSGSDADDVGPTTTGTNSDEQSTSTTVTEETPDLAFASDSALRRVKLDDGVYWSAADDVIDALVVTLNPVGNEGDDGARYELRVENVAAVNVAAPVKFDIEFDETDEVQIDGNIDWDCEHSDGVVSCVRAEDFEAAAVSIIMISTSTTKTAQTGQLAIAFVSLLVVGLGALVITRRRHTEAATSPET